MKKLLSIFFLSIIILCQNALAEAPRPPAPVFHPVGVSAEDEEFVRSKILENAPAIPVKKTVEKPKPILKKATKPKKKYVQKTVVKKTKTTHKKPTPKPAKKVETKPAVIKHTENSEIKSNAHHNLEHHKIDPHTPHTDIQEANNEELQLNNNQPQTAEEHTTENSQENIQETQNQTPEPEIDEINPDEIEADKSLLDQSFLDIYDPIKDNFFVIGAVILLFPILLFFIMMKVLNAAKGDFAEEKMLNQLIAEQEERERKEERQRPATMNPQVDLPEGAASILGQYANAYEQPEPSISSANIQPEMPVEPPNKKPEIIVEPQVSFEEEVLDKPEMEMPIDSEIFDEPSIPEGYELPKTKLFEETPSQEARDEIIKKAQARLEKKQQPSEEIEITTDLPLQGSILLEEAPSANENISEYIDFYEIRNNLKFFLSKKDDYIYLTCSVSGNETGLVKLDDAKEIQKVRKIDEKEGKDIYMIKLDSWRGLVEVSEDSAKYLMDI